MQGKNLTGGQYQPLTQQEIIRLHEAALTILEKTGFGFDEPLGPLITELEREGVRTDWDKHRVYFPREFITTYTAKAPNSIVLCSRDGNHDLRLEGNNVYFGTGGAAITVLDIDTGLLRETTLKDLYLIGRITDNLDHIHFFHRPCIPRDIPTESFDVNVYYACFKATTKHVMASAENTAGLEEVIKLATRIAGDRESLTNRPFFSLVTSFAISPLKFNVHTVPIMLTACKNNVPVTLSSAPMGGMTSPITMAGTLAQLHAEELAGIALCQYFYPGAEVLYGGIPGVSEMRSMRYMGGAVESGMMNSAIHQLSRYIGVPSYNTSGLTDSKLPDIQAGWEKALSSLLVSMAGANYIHHSAGMLESMLTVAYEQYVLDNEINALCAKVLQCIIVDDEHLALDIIDQVGPGGNFMTSQHTLDFMYTEILNRYGISDRNERNTWVKEGGRDARDRACEMTRRLLKEEGTKSCIDPEVDDHIRQHFRIYLEG
jgi:trimethylamine---corrinoid protein Co-methyltransferase